VERENHRKHFLVLDCQAPLESKRRGSCALRVTEAHEEQTKVSLGRTTEGESNFILGTKALVLGKVESEDLKRK